MSQRRQTNQLRIIAGKWRGRKLNFPDAEGLRPTPDRIRETVFNWLSPCIAGAHCLDLFAGSGALGFEALSRGAASVVMVDNSPKVVAQLKENASLLDIPEEALKIQMTDVFKAPPSFSNKFDIVFLDPPFHQGMVEQACQFLEENDLLSSSHPSPHIYIEVERELPTPPIPQRWEIIKSKVAGQVRYCLCGAR